MRKHDSLSCHPQRICLLCLLPIPTAKMLGSPVMIPSEHQRRRKNVTIQIVARLSGARHVPTRPLNLPLVLVGAPLVLHVCSPLDGSPVHKIIQGWSVNGFFFVLPARKGNNPQHSHISLPWRRGGWIAAFSKQGNTTTLHQSQQSDDKARPSKQDTGGPSHNKHMHTWAPLLLRACHSPKLSSRSVVPQRLGRQRPWLVANLSGNNKAYSRTRAHPAGSPLRSGPCCLHVWLPPFSPAFGVPL